LLLGIDQSGKQWWVLSEQQNKKRRKIMKLPKQSAPVERKNTGAAISNQNGVEANGLLDIIRKVFQR
jgi:hypothetical protein